MKRISTSVKRTLEGEKKTEKELEMVDDVRRGRYKRTEERSWNRCIENSSGVRGELPVLTRTRCDEYLHIQALTTET